MAAIKRADSLTWEENVDKILRDCRSSKSNDFRNWLTKKKGMGAPFFDSYFHKRLHNIHNAVNYHDSDHFIVLAGKEGCGKSTFAIQIASLLDPTFNINRVCFKMTDYIDRLRNSKPGQAFILDEGNMFLFNREAYSDDNRFMVKLFALMRQKNLITIICVPNFFTLDSYVRLHRVDTLIYISKRGKYIGYVKGAIKIVSKEGQRTNRMGGFKLRDGTYWPGYFTI
jgi:energy-coupling factor transporter ATP-binding protein EcfA2